MLDEGYQNIFDKGRSARLAYLQDIILSMPSYSDHNAYTVPKATEYFGATSASLTTATYDGLWVALLSEYIATCCPALYQRTVEYLSQASPAVYGSMQVMIDVRFDMVTRLIKGNLYYQHTLDGPLPYFDDLIGSLYIPDNSDATYTMADFILKWGEIHHNKRPYPWRLDQTVVIKPYTTQFGVFYEDDDSKAINGIGKLNSALWLSDTSTKYGKVHSPLTIPFEDWFVMFNMVPHGDLTTEILPRIPLELKLADTSIQEYIWYDPGETPWIPVP